jgi:hypothetical protein
MCCGNKDDVTQMNGTPGAPVGFQVNPHFMEPGGGMDESDVLGAIYQQLGLPDDEEEYPDGETSMATPARAARPNYARN